MTDSVPSGPDNHPLVATQRAPWQHGCERHNDEGKWARWTSASRTMAAIGPDQGGETAQAATPGNSAHTLRAGGRWKDK